VDERIFPYASTTIGAAFYRATHLLGIPDLHFHDLRHEAVSRLFERGYAIHEVALFSLHQNWHTLQRYTHLKAEDLPDKALTKNEK
jgi:integrase